MSIQRTLVDNVMTTSHDVSMSPHASLSGSICVDRLYCLHWPSFTDADHDALRRALVKLPGAVSEMRWYSEVDDPVAGFLKGEHSADGLRISGTVSETDWEHWCDRMHHLTCFLPYYLCMIDEPTPGAGASRR